MGKISKVKALKEGQYGDAMAMAEEVLAEDPTASALYLLAEAATEVGFTNLL